MNKLSLQGGTGTRWGLGGGLIASLCCLGPTAAALFGLTGATFLFGMLKYRPYFLAAGALFAVAGVWLTLRRSRQTCDTAQHRRNQWLFPAAALLSFGVSYGLLTYVTPALVYRSLTPAAAESQPAQISTDAPAALPVEGTGAVSDAAVPEGKGSASDTQTDAQSETATVPTLEFLEVAPVPVEAPADQAANLHRVTLAIQGMT